MMGVGGVLNRIQELRGELGLGISGGGSSFAAALAGATAGRRAGAAELLQQTAGGVSGDDVVLAAKRYLGTPYVFGSTDPGRGLDCSALVQRAYQDLGIKLPRTAHEQALAGQPVPSLAQAQPGDILAFDSPVDHVGIYLGNNMMIAAPRPGGHVKVETVYEKPTHIRRLVGDTNPLDATTTLRPPGLGSTSLAGIPYGNLFAQAGTKYGISPKLLAAVAQVESGFNADAVSKSGAQGLMQLMPSTARGLGVADSFDPAQAIDGGARLLAAHLNEFKSLPLAIAAYNAGGGAVHRYGGIPPYAETQAYVPKVQRAFAALGG